MLLMVSGLLLWSAGHLFVRLGGDTRRALIDRVGVLPYRGLFSLVIVTAGVLIVFGWRSFPPEALWVPPAWMRHVTMTLVPIAIVLFICPQAPTDIKQYLRHPQLTGVKLWAIAHLLSNGNLRDVILFGGILAWAVAEVIVINRKAGPWQKPAPVGAAMTIASTGVGLALAAAVLYFHRWFSGVPLV